MDVITDYPLEENTLDPRLTQFLLIKDVIIGLPWWSRG